MHVFPQVALPGLSSVFIILCKVTFHFRNLLLKGVYSTKSQRNICLPTLGGMEF